MKDLEKSKMRRFLAFLCTLILVTSTLTVAAGVLFPASGEIGPAEDGEIILIERAGAEEISLLNEMDVDIVDRYNNYVLVEVEEEDIAILEQAGLQVNTLPNRSHISVKGNVLDVSDGELNRPFETAEDSQQIASDLEIDGYESGEEGLYLVNMLGPINPDWRQELEKQGVNIINYVPNYAYEVSMTPEQVEDVEDKFFVDWVGIYQPSYKVHPETEPGTVTIRSRPEAEIDSAATLETKLNVLAVEDLQEEGYRVTGEVQTEKAIEDLAMMNDVYYISPYVEPELHAEMDIQLIGGGQWFMDDEYDRRDDLTPPPREGDPQEPYRKHGDYGAYMNQLGYSGEGITITTADTGVGDGTVGDAGVEDFTGRVIGGYGFGADEDNWQDGHYHGTACTGLITGDTYGGTGDTWDEFQDGDMEYYMGQGLAYESEIFGTKIFDDGGGFMPTEYYPIVEEPAQRSDAYIHSNSWGAGTMGEYSDSDEIFDQAVRDADRDADENVPMVITTSAGNDGGRGDYSQEIGSPANSKNVITIGGNQPYNPGLGYNNPENMYGSSSRGWTEDNRIKPDLIAPSESVISQNTPLEGGGYVAASGTSFGNPLVAGAATIVVDWYEQNYEETPSPAMVKSILINTANELDPEVGNTDENAPNTKGHVPNRNEGWGVPDISKLEYPTDDPIGFEFVDQEILLETGDIEEYTISADDEDEPLKVTLTWTDKHAMEGDSAGGTPTLKNNLNLEVETPGGEIIRGNAFDQTGDGASDDGFTYPDAEVMADFDYNDDGWDDVNNVQNVYIHPDEVEGGTYTVRVMGTDIPEDANDDGTANQDFALTAYNVPEVAVPEKDGEIMFERDEYRGDEVVNITLTDVILEGEGTHDVDVSSLDAEGNELENITVTLEEHEENLGVFEGSVQLTEDQFGDGLYVEHDGEIKAWYWDEDPGHPDELDDEGETMSLYGEELHGDIKIAVVDETDYMDGGIAANLEEYLPEEYAVDTLEADELIGEMKNYDGFVPWRFGSDTLADDFLDELEEDQGVVYLDSYTGATDEAYGDAVERLHNVRNDPGDWTGHSMSGPIEIEIYEDHDIFEDVGGEGDVVTLYDDTGTVYGSHYSDYTGKDLAEVRYDDGADVGEGLGINEDENEIIYPAMSIDFFAEPDDPWTEESWTLLANSVEFLGERVLHVESPPSVVNDVDEHPVEVLVTNPEDQDETDVTVDVTIYNETMEEEYFDEETIDIDAEEEVLVEFADWAPSEQGEFVLNTTAEMHGEEHITEMDILVANIDDVGVEEIISPADWVNSEEAHEVETSVHNYGTMDLTDVPVETTISQQEVALHEDFEEDIPDGWTIDNTTDEPYTWHHDGDMAFVEGNQDIVQDEWLISPTIDLTDATGTGLEFDHDFDTSSFSGDSWGRVQVSADGGDSWEMIDEWEAEESESGVFEYDISGIADGEEEVQVAFEWDSPGDVGGDFDDWSIFEVSVTYLEEEYFDETTVDVDAGESVTAVFDDWNPSEEGEFFMNSTTNLEGDEDPTNDYTTKWIQVEDYRDVGITEILSPIGEAFIEDTHDVSAVMENFGSYHEEDVPVEATIGEIIELLNEDFEEEIPDEWEIDDTAEEPYTWHWDETFDDIPMAYVEEQEDWQDEWLISPAIDASDAQGTTLELDHDFYTSGVSGDSYGRIKVSPDGGNTWEMIEEWEPEESVDGVFEYDISDYADGQEEVQVAFVFNSTDADESTFDDWEIYEVTIDYTDPVYEDDITVDIDMQEEIEVDFEDWDPTEGGWHRVIISTDMEGDEDPTNDYEIDYVRVTDEHDLVVDEITQPEAEVWNETQPVEATISNVGDFDEEEVPVHATAERVIGLMEDFSGEFPPAGWDTDDWTQSQSNEAGGEPPEAEISWTDVTEGYAYLESPAVDTTGTDDLTLGFYSYINDFSGGYNARVLARSTPGEDYEDVTPWDNPISGDVGPDHYEVEMDDYIGSGTQIMFDIDTDWDVNSWYVNDVMMGYTEEEYTNTTHIDIERGETKTVDFADWTPTTAGSYIFNVTADHEEEENPETATKEKGVYARPMIWDLEATSIDAPEEPIFQYEEEVLGTVTNVGNQDITEAPVNMTIQPVNEDIPIDEDFSEGMPEGWTAEDRDENDNTWEWSEEEESMMITPEDDMEHDVLWTEIADCSMGEHRVILEFYSNFEGPNDRDLLISRDGGESYRKIDRNIGEGEMTYDITQFVSEEEEVMIGWEFYSYEVEEDEFWEIDDVKITNEYLTEEYESQAIVDELNVTEETQLQFDNWAPEELPSDYIVTMTTMHPEDDNEENIEIHERVFAREYVPPQKPIDPIPYDGEENVTHSPIFNVTLYGDEEMPMDATFYLYDEDGEEIGNKTDEGIPSGEQASVQFFLLETDSTFYWNVTVEDGIANNESDTWTFDTYVPEGRWKTASADINIEPPEPVENLHVDWDADVWNAEANELTWDASPDDGAGADDTDHYVIYRSDSEDGPWDDSTMIDTVEADGSDDYTYMDEGKADDGVQWNYVVRAVDRVGNMEMNEDPVGEMPLPSATDPEPGHGEEVEDLEQTVSAMIELPNDERFDVTFHHGTTRDILAEYQIIRGQRLEAEYELEEEDMGEYHHWFVVVSYADYNFGRISPSQYSLEINTDGGGTVEVEPEQDAYLFEQEVNLTAVPDEDWEFVEWTGDYEGTDEEITIIMDSDKEITAHFELEGDYEGEWRWLYEGDHRFEAENAVGLTAPGDYYGAMILDLSDDVGGYISEVAYYDYDGAGDWAYGYIAEDDDGAPGEWLSETDEYEPEGAGWVELELNELVKIEEPGEYWIVMHLDDLGEGHFPFGVDETHVDDGGWINFEDPRDPADWDDMADVLPGAGSWGLEAQIEVPVDGNSQLASDDITPTADETQIAVIDEDNWQENEVEYKLEDYLPEEYTVDTLEAHEVIDNMDQYHGFVIQRFGSDSLAEDFLDELEDHQGVVYLDTHQGATSEAYSDGVYRLHNVRNDPETRDSEGLGTDPPQYLEILEDHPIFEDVGEAGDSILMYDGTTNWASWFDDYSGEILGEMDYGGGYEGPAVGISEDGTEVLLPAKGIGFFGEADDPGWTEEANQLLANAVETTVGDPEYEAMGWNFYLEDTIPPEAHAGEDIEAWQGETVMLNGSGSTDNVEVVEWEWTIEDPTGEETVLYGPYVNYTLEYALYYDVELTVYDEAGNSDTDTIEIYATDTEDPVADAGTSGQTRVGEEFTLDGSGSTDNVEVVEWTWHIEGVAGEAEGYEETIYGETVDHVFPYEGTYEIELEVSDAEDNTDNDDITIFVQPALYDLTVETEGEGTVDIYPHMDEYEDGTEVELIAEPDEGWEFVEWTGDYQGTDASIQITMDDDKEITAHFEELEPAYFEVEVIDFDEEVEEGDVVTVGYRVSNTGELEGTQTIEFEAAGETIYTMELTLEAGEEYEGEFTWDTDGVEEGEYDVGLRSEDDDNWVTISVEEPEPAYFEVEVIDFDEEVEEGDVVTIGYRVTNTGGLEGTQTIVFEAAGEIIDTMELTLEAGEEYEGEFTWDTDGVEEEGEYDVGLRSEDDDNWVTITVEEEEEDEFLDIPGFTIILLILSAVIAVAIYHKKEQ